MTVLKENNLIKALLAIISGASTALAFAPLSLFWLAPLTLATLFLITTHATSGRAALYGWLFGVGFFGLGINWVHISIHVYGGSSLVLAWGAAIALILFMSCYTGAILLLANKLMPQAGIRRFLVVLPGSWIMLEWVRSWLFTGFPWLEISYSQMDGYLSGYAPVLGHYGVAWLLLLTAGCLSLIVSRTTLRIHAVLLLLILWGTGYGLQSVSWTQPLGAPLAVSVLQGNISQDMKWEPSQRLATLERYMHMSRREWYGDPDWSPDLIVWPETAIPAFYHQVEEGFIPELQREVAAAQSSLITGIPVLDRSDWQYYNAVISTNPATQFYYKRHLVPFGEYLPLRDWLDDMLAVMPLPVADFSAGPAEQPLLQAAGYPVGVTVCYEIVFAREVHAHLPEAAFLVNVSNDAWFGQSWAPHQHLEMTRMRALEAGRYLLRATNTGISAVIKPDGGLSGVSPQFEMAVVRDSIQPMQGATPYVRWGDWPVLILSLSGLLISAWKKKQ